MDTAERPALRVETQSLFRLVYLWMGLGLVLTAIVGMFTASHEVTRQLLHNQIALFGALIIELVLVGKLSASVEQMSTTRAVLSFFLYAALNGFSLAIIFVVFDLNSLTSAFAITAALFGVMAVIGFRTRLDLTELGSYLLMAIVGLLIALCVNLIIGSKTLEVFISLVGVAIFVGLVAYDTQKIKRIAANPAVQSDNNLLVKLSILGALTLYLDFINLLLFLLSLFGDSDD